MPKPKKRQNNKPAPLTERQRRIHDFLAGHRSGVLSMVDPDGEPHGVVVYYSFGRDFILSFLTRVGTKKYDDLMHNDHVMMVVFEPPKQQVAQVIGKAKEVRDSYKINEVASDILRASLDSDSGMPPVVKLDAGEYTAFRIIPDQIRMSSYSSPESGDYDNVVEAIESFDLKDI